MNKNINIKDYNYSLPEHKIAKYPLSQRDKSKLLIYNKSGIKLAEFKDLINILPDNNLLIFNDTKVINARFYFFKETGAKIEIFCLEPSEPQDYALSLSSTGNCKWKCLVGNSKKWKNDILVKKLKINNKEFAFSAKKLDDYKDSYFIEFSWDNTEISFSQILEEYGNVPIPPYLNRNSEEIDKTRYQTVYGVNQGSVAAPTAGLHFTDELIEKLKSRNFKFENLTLHVGAGTFQPVKTDNLQNHPMHIEHFSISKNTIKSVTDNLNNITVVGTTTVRSIESIYCVGRQIMNNINIGNNFFVSQWEAYDYEDNVKTEIVLQTIIDRMTKNNQDYINCSTQIMIVPGYKFRICDRLITNSHQPKSTLLLLVAAFIGNDWRKVYDFALENDFRFLSYGDSMLLNNE